MRVRVYPDGRWQEEDDASRAEDGAVNAPSDDYMSVKVPDMVRAEELDIWAIGVSNGRDPNDFSLIRA